MTNYKISHTHHIYHLRYSHLHLDAILSDFEQLPTQPEDRAGFLRLRLPEKSHQIESRQTTLST